MIQSFKIVNNRSESITLDIRKPENTGFLVTSVTGLTFPKAEISSQEIAMFDGGTVTNRRIGPRNIVMNIIFYDSNNDKNTIEELRHKCYKYFPIKQQITFYVTNDSGTYYIKGYIESNETNIFSKVEAAQISIICPDPYFSKSDADKTAYVSSIIPNFQFPVSFEFEGDSTPDGYTKYSGTYLIVPTKSAQTITLGGKAYFGNLIVTRVVGKRTSNGSGKGYTLTIQGSPTAVNSEYIDEEEFIYAFNPYSGSATQNVDPAFEDQVLSTKGYYYEQLSGSSAYKIVVQKIPSETTENAAGKGLTFTVNC